MRMKNQNESGLIGGMVWYDGDGTLRSGAV